MAVRVINNDSHYHREMSAAGSKLVVVDFTASWCGPCQMIAPVFEQLASKYPRAIFLKVDVDKCQETAAAEGVSSIPTFIFYKNKATLDRIQGVNPSALESKIQQFYGFGEEEGGHVMGRNESNMRWFEGDIAQAVTQSRAQNAVFVVFVEGQDVASKRIGAAIDNPSVSEKLNGQSFICIKLQSGTQTFNQFSQIYRDPPVPSIYFIGRNGSPIEIVTQTANSKSLLEKILHVEDIHFGRPSGSADTAESSSKPTKTAQTPAATSTSALESKEASNASEPSTSSAPIDERVERAKGLLEEKRMAKKAQEEEEARQKEMLRRKEGQSVQELRRWQQEQELKQLREERLRDKRLEQEARQRVLDQIAQDRAARNARNVTSTPSSATTPATTTTSASASNSNEARLQFRLPDGSTHSNRFNADNTLADVRQYILSNITLPYRDFALATAFPRREFSSEDNATTLLDLQLVPSSVILIIPAGGHTAVQQSGAGLFGLVQTILMFVTYPVTQLFSIFRGFIFGAPTASGTNPSSTNSAGSAHSQSQGNASSEKRSQKRSGGAYRRSGPSNVHRLHQNNSSSDDENNTWNGNSTQQM